MKSVVACIWQKLNETQYNHAIAEPTYRDPDLLRNHVFTLKR
jgi:hypothetical protein